MANDLVLTPGGYRKRSDVQLIKPGHAWTLEREWDSVEPAERPDRAMLDPLVPLAAQSKANWMTAAWWLNTTGTPITSFRTTWQVPPPPSKKVNQLIYLFSGMLSANSTPILQPVLQWGGVDADRDGVTRVGPFWTVASWLAFENGVACHTEHVVVQPGDILVGVIKLIGKSGGRFNYTCEFEGIAGTTLPGNGLPEMVWCVEAFEPYELDNPPVVPYDLNDQAEYPDTNPMAFQKINIRMGSVSPPGSWRSETYPPFKGYSDLLIDSSTDGEIDIYFK